MSVSMIKCFITIATLLQQLNFCTPLETSSNKTIDFPPPITEYKECSSVDIRNECESFLVLRGCTVITGFMIIALVPNHNRAPCNYDEYKFPELREITGYLIFYEVRGLKLLRNMFPYLTVIRGRKLFMNYAFGMTMMPALELLEFNWLVAIQRGHIYISSNPKLCQLERINVKRLTLSVGENQIIQKAKDCDQRAGCRGCYSDYCWSNFICQRFENDNLANHSTDTTHCHAQCLGGCYNETNAGCVVCRGLTDHGVCVEKCPEDKYLLEQFQRCYTHKECVNIPGHWTFGFTCVPFCPSGYKGNITTRDCVQCDATEACVSTCTPEYLDEGMIIYNLADADEIRGCQIVNSSLIIQIHNEINEKDLTAAFASIREIRGHLKVYRSSMTSLKFLSNLRIIHGDPLESDHYGVIFYDNKNLRELWNADQLELLRGGIYMDRNYKLCNQHMREFEASATHDKTMDSLQISDQEVLCGPAKLNLYIRPISHHEIKFSWPKQQTNHEVEIIYRIVLPNHTYVPETDLDAPICTRIHWQRRLLFKNEIIDGKENVSSTHYAYIIRNLQPNTRYACLVRSFGPDYTRDTRSEVLYTHTYPEVPTPPLIQLVNKTNTSLTISVILQNRSMELMTHGALRVYELMDDQEYIDHRNYCKQPLYLLKDTDTYHSNSHTDDYDNCCARQMEKEKDKHFIAAIRDEYNCRIDRPHLCHLAEMTFGDLQFQQPKQFLQLHLDIANHTIDKLTNYRLYTIQATICNDAACSAHATLIARTNYTGDADQVTNLKACHRPNEEGIFHVRFNEPIAPNSVIVSYVVHYRKYVEETQRYISNVSCVTRKQHAENNYLFIDKRNQSFTQTAVRVHSLAGDVLTDWVNITVCTPNQIEEDSKMTHHEITKTSAMPSQDSFHANFFLFSIMIGAFGTIIWVLYKRRYWRRIRRCWRTTGNTSVSLDQQDEDRETLVNNYENSVVVFQNIREDSEQDSASVNI